MTIILANNMIDIVDVLFVFHQDIDEVTKVIAIKKANGEAAHLSCLEISGRRYLCIGSKVNRIQIVSATPHSTLLLLLYLTGSS